MQHWRRRYRTDDATYRRLILVASFDEGVTRPHHECLDWHCDSIVVSLLLGQLVHGFTVLFLQVHAVRASIHPPSRRHKQSALAREAVIIQPAAPQTVGGGRGHSMCLVEHRDIHLPHCPLHSGPKLSQRLVGTED